MKPNRSLQSAAVGWLAAVTCVPQVAGASDTPQVSIAVQTQYIQHSSYMSLTVSGLTGKDSQVEYAESLTSQTLWRPLAGVTSSAAPWMIVDPASTNAHQRFYRLLRGQGISGRIVPGWGYFDPTGTVHTIEFVDPRAGMTNWRTLQTITLVQSPYLFVDGTAPNPSRRRYRSTRIESSVIPIPDMVFIPSGTFVMGSPASEPARLPDEGPQTRVTISRGFFIGKYEVTQREYVDVMGTNPSYFRNGTDGTNFDGTGGTITQEGRHPVEQVSWDEAQAYCATLTERERQAGRLSADWRYRLPTEAEWEYACRAGTTTAFHDGEALRSGQANFHGRYEYPPCAGPAFPYSCENASGTYLGRTTEVGSYFPNAWGLYDMHGNVWEWCSDWGSPSLPGGSVTDPSGSRDGLYHVLRGGSWRSLGWYCRAAGRHFNSPGYRSLVGFRVVLALGPP